MTTQEFFQLVTKGADLPLDRWSGYVQDRPSLEAREPSVLAPEEKIYVSLSVPR
jgi:hypothetical protein